jgi:D-alanyl-D-alanine carboxypeptidase
MIWRDAVELPLAREERGQAALLMLAVVAAVLAGAVVLFAFGNALGAMGRGQRAVDLSAIGAAQVMRSLYPRLFEPPFTEPDVPNPRHLEEAEYRALAVAAAVRGGRKNGAAIRRDDVTLGGSGFAPTRVTVRVRGEAHVRTHAGHEGVGRIPVRARATAELLPDPCGAPPGHGSGGGYSGPLAYRQGKPMRPDVALAFDRLAAAAREEAGLFLSISSGFRSDAEQARLFAAHPDPKWVAPPGESLHRYATELDLGPPAAYGWLEANADRFGFTKRYAWEDWH